MSKSLLFCQLFQRTLCTSSRDGVYFIPRIRNDFVINGELGKPLTIVIKTAAKSINILKGAEGISVKKMNIIATKVHGDIALRYASETVDKVRIWVNTLDGDIKLPKTGGLGPKNHRASHEWLRLHVGPIKNIAAQIPMKREFDDVMDRLVIMKRSTSTQESNNEADNLIRQGDTQVYKIPLEREPHTENVKVVGGEDQISYYILTAENPIQILPLWNRGVIPEMNIFVHTAYEGIIVN